MQANTATGLWGSAYRYPHQGMVLPLHFGQHSAVSGLPGAGDTLRGLSAHRPPGQEAPAVSILHLVHQMVILVFSTACQATV